MGCLRLFLAISVLIAHSGPLLGSQFVGGPPAVQAFFAISGFYMALVLSEKYQPGRLGTQTFWLNRLLRLGPTYVLVMAATVVWTATRDHSPFFQAMAGLDLPWRAAIWAVNAVGLGLDGLLFGVLDPASGGLKFHTRPDPAAPNSAMVLQLVPQGWSLALEAYFYVLAPWLVRLRMRWLLAVIGLSAACRLVLAKAGLSQFPFYYQFFPNELATFLLGVVAYRGYRHYRRFDALARRLGWLALPAVLAFAFVWFRLPVPAKSLGFAVVVAALVPVLFAGSKSAKWDRLIGELSYPLYLSHGLIATMLGEHGHHAGLLLAVSLAVSAVVVLAVEWPIDRIRQHLASRVGRKSELVVDTPMPVTE